MCASRPRLLAAFILTAICWIDPTAIAEPDQTAARRVLGPQWQHISRRAGIVFAGTMLADDTTAGRTDRGIPSITLRFRVDRAIAGVEPGQILTIHEWTGAWSLQKPMRRGERLLLFLYPPSSLGLTSPVGGFSGQVRLDSTGCFAAQKAPAAPIPANQRNRSNSPPRAAPTRSPVATLDQLERAIRAARSEP